MSPPTDVSECRPEKSTREVQDDLELVADRGELWEPIEVRERIGIRDAQATTDCRQRWHVDRRQRRNIVELDERGREGKLRRRDGRQVRRVLHLVKAGHEQRGRIDALQRRVVREVEAIGERRQCWQRDRRERGIRVGDHADVRSLQHGKINRRQRRITTDIELWNRPQVVEGAEGDEAAVGTNRKRLRRAHEILETVQRGQLRVSDHRKVHVEMRDRVQPAEVDQPRVAHDRDAWRVLEQSDRSDVGERLIALHQIREPDLTNRVEVVEGRQLIVASDYDATGHRRQRAELRHRSQVRPGDEKVAVHTDDACELCEIRCVVNRHGVIDGRAIAAPNRARPVAHVLRGRDFVVVERATVVAPVPE